MAGTPAPGGPRQAARARVCPCPTPTDPRMGDLAMTSGNHPPDAPPHDPDDELLPCGRLLSRVWADREDGTADDHARTCPHCRQAAGDLDRLETAARKQRDGPATTPPFDAAPLTRRVVDAVRGGQRPGPPLPLGEPGEDLWIVEAAAARVLRTAAELAPGVRAGSCRVVPAGGTTAGRVAVRLGIQAPLGAPDLPGLAEQARGHVRRAAERRLGLRIEGVDIHITDLSDGPDTPDAPAPAGVTDRAAPPGRTAPPDSPEDFEEQGEPMTHAALGDELAATVRRVPGVAFLAPGATGRLGVALSGARQDEADAGGLHVSPPDATGLWRIDARIVTRADARALDTARATAAAVGAHLEAARPGRTARVRVTVTGTV